MYHFCTYFDHNYLSAGVALYRSLSRYCDAFVLWVLCLDQISYDVLRRAALPHIRLISLPELEREDARLLAAKQDRSLIEYYFTCSPFLPTYVLTHCPEVEVLTYLDADLFFFSEPSAIYRELGKGSVLIVEHRFPPHLQRLAIYGTYNVGLLAFRNDADGRQCLAWWGDRCLEWCYDRVETGRFADQKYLDDWPSRFRNVVVLQHRGAGLAPWNVAQHRLRVAGDRVWVDSEPLVFFHFAGLEQLGSCAYDPALERYGLRPTGVLKHGIYAPYVRELRAAARWVSTVTADGVATQKRSVRRIGAGGNSVRPRIMRRTRRFLSIGRKLLQWRLLLVIGDKML